MATATGRLGQGTPSRVRLRASGRAVDVTASSGSGERNTGRDIIGSPLVTGEGRELSQMGGRARVVGRVAPVRRMVDGVVERDLRRGALIFA